MISSSIYSFFNLFIYLQNAAVYIFIGAAGLFSDVWAAWTELIINISVTLLLAPTYGIAGILTGKILSVLFINMFWKPYYLFSQGFNKSVLVFWRGMTPYYTIFAVFTFFALVIRYTIVAHYIDSLLSLVIYGTLIDIILLSTYFISLFIFTRGMKYFIARKPILFRIFNKFPLS